MEEQRMTNDELVVLIVVLMLAILCLGMGNT